MSPRTCPICEKESEFDEKKFSCCLARYSSGQAARVLGISKNTIYLLEKKGRIEPVRRQTRNRYRIFTDDDLFRFSEFWNAVEPAPKS